MESQKDYEFEKTTIDIIKKISFKLFIIENSLVGKINKDDNIFKEFKNIDKELNSHFKIKLSKKDKENFLELSEILK